MSDSWLDVTPLLFCDRCHVVPEPAIVQKLEALFASHHCFSHRNPILEPSSYSKPNKSKSYCPTTGRSGGKTHHHHHQQTPQHAVKKEENLKSLLNKLTESNYDKLLPKIREKVELHKVLEKAYVEHRYIALYVRLIRECELSEDLALEVAAEIEKLPEAVERHHATTDYDEFCRNNVLSSRAVGVNKVAILLFESALLDPTGHAKRLIEMKLNEVSVRLLEDIFQYGVSANERRRSGAHV